MKKINMKVKLKMNTETLIYNGFNMKPGFISFKIGSDEYITSGRCDCNDQPRQIWAYRFDEAEWKGEWLSFPSALIYKIHKMQADFILRGKFKSAVELAADLTAKGVKLSTTESFEVVDEYDVLTYTPTNVVGVYHVSWVGRYNDNQSEYFDVLTEWDVFSLLNPEEAKDIIEYEEACKKASTYSKDDLAIYDGKEGGHWVFTDVVPGEKRNNGGEYGFYTEYYPTETCGVYLCTTSCTCDFDPCGTGREGYVVLTKEKLQQLIVSEEEVLERGCLY